MHGDGIHLMERGSCEGRNGRISVGRERSRGMLESRKGREVERRWRKGLEGG